MKIDPARTRMEGDVTSDNLLPSLPEIESRVCDIASEQLGIRRADLHPSLRLIQDLHCDSIDVLDFFFRLEKAFDVWLPYGKGDPSYKAVFTRDPLRLSDFSEAIYLQKGLGAAGQRRRDRRKAPLSPSGVVPFTQLNGRAEPEAYWSVPLHEPLGESDRGIALHRRRTDGMVCVQVPAAEAWIGAENQSALPDEQPAHRAWVDAFLIDQEPISTTAYCRFLNSIGPVDAEVLQEWFMLTPDDKRREHELVHQHDDGWAPLSGAERMPMMLVSWYGANAYSLWANRRDWSSYRSDESFLPSEAQWEYAARGAERREYPWGEEAPTPQRMQFAQHEPGREYRPEALPMANVNADMGVSPFGLRHMAGNVWQWCRDWYAPDFYRSTEATKRNPLNQEPSGIRSERGGSWVGPAFLCRSSYRRGRVPIAKGRCLGFRCISEARG